MRAIEEEQARLFKILLRLGLIEMNVLKKTINKLQVRLIVKRRCCGDWAIKN